MGYDPVLDKETVYRARCRNDDGCLTVRQCILSPEGSEGCYPCNQRYASRFDLSGLFSGLVLDFVGGSGLLLCFLSERMP